MFCPKCGRKCEDDSCYCAECGNRLPVTENHQIVRSSSESVLVHTEAEQERTTLDPLDPAYTMLELKKFAASPIVIVLAIVMTLLVLINFMGAGNILDSVVDNIEDTLVDIGIDKYQAEEISSALDDILENEGLEKLLSSLSFWSALPGAVVAGGIWIIVISAYQPERYTLNSNGVNVIRIIAIAEAVYVGVMALILGATLMSACTNLQNAALELKQYGYSQQTALLDGIQNVIAVVLVIVFLLSVVVITFYAKLAQTMGRIKYSIDEGVPNSELSTFVIVVCFVCGSASMLSAFAQFDSGMIFNGLLSAASQFLTGTVLLHLRQKMETLWSEIADHRKKARQFNDVAHSPKGQGETEGKPVAMYQKEPTWKRIAQQQNTSEDR